MAGHRDQYYNLGSYRRVVTTSSDDAQTWFDRGLMWTYGFNHEEAIACFKRATESDPMCIMAYWGIAYCLGPNYNKPWEVFDDEELANALEESRRAMEKATTLSHSIDATEVEKMLIPPLYYRYYRGPQEQKKDSCKRYAEAMREVYERYPDDVDVASLYAEALMNLTPWALWNITTGKPAERARTMEIKDIIERGLKRNPDHPGLIHMYIHLMEMSPFPEKALNAADRLRGLVPDSGHLNHMPSHLDILCGDYRRAIEANTQAVVADDKFFATVTKPRFYTLYQSHDIHFRLYAAMFAGKLEVALDSAKRLHKVLSKELLQTKTPPMANWLEGFVPMDIHVLVRFGKWEDLVAKPLPDDRELYCFTTAMTYYGKGVALANLNRVDEAKENLALFLKACEAVPKTRTVFNNTCRDILAIAREMVSGEIDYFAGQFDTAMAHLRRGVELESALPYDEPWGWMQPTRHALGALLLERGRVAEACQVYKEDLGFTDGIPRPVQHRNNVWALHGLHECLVRLGKADEARLVKGQLDLAMAVADVEIGASCFCRKELYKGEDCCGGSLSKL